MDADVIVVGAGLWGSACARHLSEMGLSTVLVGPDEPRDASSHTGVFSSHYDEARITRRLASDRDWSRLAQASMARYADMEARSGHKFHAPVGALMVGAKGGVGAGFVANTREVAQQEDFAFQELEGPQLDARFPFLSFPGNTHALYEEDGGGWINPRQHILAEIAIAKQHGAKLHRSEVVRLSEVGGTVTAQCADGEEVTAKKAVVACGAFSKAAELLPEAVPLTAYARTIAFLEIDPAEARRLQAMPSFVYVPPGTERDTYVLPPVTYPDGKTYLKIGGDPEDHELVTVADMKTWFRGGGNARVGELLADQLKGLMPDLRVESVSHGACVTCFTPKGAPLIYPQSERIFALTGGNGAGAKCADEIGRLGALMVAGHELASGPYASDFTP
ncbi:NAD(P)/FAD-dependent oxidoreductase [Shimia sp. MMG029]|uniref:NAD(P)/FAD-dependent oxidoreductase n=1 Tax=Shimia sp. MMG029 TaxID=3021978 RepID=UPI0022FE24EE|nr:FAD-dependent oxidoreductase [Shimia sp. MMG029]MDA5556473.1 FAD-dependent oxidoreductase [Shimia sp. MMG029]